MNFIQTEEQIDQLNLKVLFGVPKQEFDHWIAGVSASYMKSAKIPGFRPGKIPSNILWKHYGSDIFETAFSQMVKKLVADYVNEKQLKLIAPPNIKLHERDGLISEKDAVDSNQQGVVNGAVSEMKIEVLFRIFPKFPLKEFEKIKVSIEKPKPIDDSQVEQVIRNIATRFATPQEVSDREQPEKGDICEVTIWPRLQDGKSDGVVNQATREYQEHIDLTEFGDPEIASLVIGMKLGEKKELPAESKFFDWQTIRLDKIKRLILPEINDEFLEKNKIYNARTLEELKSALRAQLERETESQLEQKIQHQVLESLIEQNTFNLPETWIEEQILSIAKNNGELTDEDIQNKKYDLKSLKDKHLDQALKILKRSLIVGELYEKYNIQVEQPDIELRSAMIGATHGASRKAIKKALSNEEFRENLISDIKFEKLLKQLREIADVEYT
ncbi:MAG TPA: trigger factor [Oligoflexia bacterium]|nr:trigger factor [Oligoflexia bacterium]HMP27494.1 trigger factor [Oligoflexia bacterium]